MPAMAIWWESTTVSTPACRMASPPQPKTSRPGKPRLESPRQARAIDVAGALSGHDHDAKVRMFIRDTGLGIRERDKG